MAVKIIYISNIWHPNCYQHKGNLDAGNGNQDPINGNLDAMTKTVICPCKQQIARATGPVLTSVKEEKHIILQNTLNIAVRRGKLWTYTLQNTPKVFSKFAPSGLQTGGYKE